MDSDFDGFISKKDLRKFLANILKINNEEISKTQIDRLFKLMDTFKRGVVKITDIKKLINSQSVL